MGADQVQGQSTKGEEGHWLKSLLDSPMHSALTPAGPQYLSTPPSHPCLSEPTSESQETGRSPTQGVLTGMGAQVRTTKSGGQGKDKRLLFRRIIWKDRTVRVGGNRHPP